MGPGGDLKAFLPPDSSVDALDRVLRETGWVREPDRSSDSDSRAEPVLVSWSRPRDDGEIDYIHEPETGLRKVEIRGMDAADYLAALSRTLPVLSVEDIQALLRSSDPKRIGLGLRIAGEMRDGRLAGDVLALTRHADETVRLAAQGAIQQAVAEISPAASPRDPAAIFTGIPDFRYRRQTLRWLLREQPEAGPAEVATLAAALRDADWEVRATAVLAAARWRARDVLPLIRACDLEPRGGLGPNRFDAAILRETCRLAEHLLLGGPVLKAAPDAAPNDRLRARLCQAIAGQPVEPPDHASVLILALTEPVPSDIPEPPSPLPPEIVRDAAGWKLAAADLPLRWIPPVPCWLGDDLPGMLAPRALERVRPKTGFFLAEGLVPDWTGTFDEARKLCEALGGRLPTADEWERAARGPDGRVFPWGNGMDRDASTALSPWGCRDLIGEVGQWTSTVGPSGQPLVCGTSSRGCAARAPRDPGERFGVRPVLESRGL